MCIFAQKKEMKKKGMIWGALLIGTVLNAQAPSNNLEGYFKSNKKDALYTSIHLDGKGHALINDGFQAEYVQNGDKLYVFPDKSVFVFKVENGRLKGESSWVEKATFKKSEVPFSEEPFVFPAYTVDAGLLFDFYKLNYKEGTDEGSFYMFENEEDYIKQMASLCDKGLTSACGAYFGTLYLQSAGGLESLLDENALKGFSKNPEMEEIANRMIMLGDVRGYGLLGSYLYAAGNEQEALKVYNEGMEKGDQNCAAVLFQLELEKGMDEAAEDPGSLTEEE